MKLRHTKVSLEQKSFCYKIWYLNLWHYPCTRRRLDINDPIIMFNQKKNNGKVQFIYDVIFTLHKWCRAGMRSLLIFYVEKKIVYLGICNGRLEGRPSVV